jgi:uncharacterized protein (DUF433 family)
VSEDKIVLQAFPESQAASLTGLSASRLRQWNRSGFFKPSFRNEPGHGEYNRLYNFKDIVCLKVISVLLNEHGIPVPVLRETLKRLFRLDQSRWASETLYVLGKRVYFDAKDVEAFQDATSDQLALHHLPLRMVQTELEKAVYETRGRDPNSYGLISKARGVVGSQPVIQGTRITVRAIKDLLDEGLSIKKIREYYPHLTPEDIHAAGQYNKAA